MYSILRAGASEAKSFGMTSGAIRSVIQYADNEYALGVGDVLDNVLQSIDFMIGNGLGGNSGVGWKVFKN